MAESCSNNGSTPTRQIRLAMGMSQADLARKVRINQRSLHQLEISESLKTIRLSSLERVADALDCELVYAFVPRGSLQSNYELQAHQMAKRQIMSIEQNMRLEKQEHKMSKENLEAIKRELIRNNAVRWEPDA